MSALDVDEVIESDDVCTNCAHRLGPVILSCGCPKSDFFKGPVHPEGWCDQFARVAVSSQQRGE